MKDSNIGGGRNTDRGTAAQDWSNEERFWRDNYSSRPYAGQNRDFDEFRPGYRYGYEAAGRHRGRQWNDVEPELRAGWDRYEHRGENRSTWDQIKDSVRDAWDRVTGDDDADRTRR
jgi:hypothetical protein